MHLFLFSCRPWPVRGNVLMQIEHGVRYRTTPVRPTSSVFAKGKQDQARTGGGRKKNASRQACRPLFFDSCASLFLSIEIRERRRLSASEIRRNMRERTRCVLSAGPLGRAKHGS